MAIVIVGGTGDLGFGLAYRWAKAGLEVVIGSREAAKAEKAAAELNQMAGGSHVKGMCNQDAVREGELVVLAIPDAARGGTFEALAPLLSGKMVLDVTIPLRFNPLRYEAPPEGSNAEQTQAGLGEAAKVVCGFHTVSAAMLADPEKEIHGDVIILGNDAESRTFVLGLAEKIGLRAFDGGPLRHARTVEGLTPMIIGMNKRYKRGHIGVCLTGI